jgi:hypothetical protein
MDKKKTGKKTRKSAKSVRDLPAKTLNAKRAKGVKGGAWDLVQNKKSG